MSEVKKENKDNKKANSKTKENGTRWYLIVLWSMFAVAVTCGFGLFYGINKEWFGDMPTFEELENPSTNLATEIISADGKILGTYYIENRSNVSYSELSPHLVNALLAIEDIRFYEHSGIDQRALMRVIFGIATGNDKGGGSTLTQQLAKNLFPRGENLSTPQLVIRKFQEWVTATKLEYNYSKDEIIAMYLNTVFYGHNAYGIKKASETFFNVEPKDLNIEQAAFLAGVVNAPSRYSPIRHPERATSRRNLVISQMATYGFITEQERDSISQIPIDMSEFGVLDHNSGQATYLREYLRGTLTEWAKTHTKPDGTPYNIYKDGLKIYTTIDSRMQRYAEEAVREHLSLDLQPAFDKHWKGEPNAPFSLEEEEIEALMELSMKRSERYRVMKKAGISIDSIRKNFNKPTKMTVFSWNGPIDTIMTPMDSMRYYKSFLQSSLMSVESHTGHVKAYVGGIDYKYFKYDHVTQARRQVGSTFKPFLYSLAMQEGEYTPCTKVPNISYSIEMPDGKFWEPRDAGKTMFGEEVTLKWALAHSNNRISTYLMKRFGPEAVIQMARRMGVTSHIDAVPSICLGVCDLSLYEMVGAMNTFANRGVYIKPIFITKIEDKNGNVIEYFHTEQVEAMDDVTAYKMIELMKGVVQSGTGVRLKYKYGLKNPIAGKTGTTQNQSDGWFMGITPDLTTGIWTGAEDRAVHFRTIGLGQGSNMALPVWAIYMKKIYADPTLNISQGDFEKPLSDVALEFDCELYEQEQSQKNTVVAEEEEF
ncbi:MAG: PBP1A family penicillin-binding protein [Bacteroidales bacterium]|nr:PBP1A family penicillin-binding protein [Bacteroidales bacterium]